VFKVVILALRVNKHESILLLAGVDIQDVHQLPVARPVLNLGVCSPIIETGDIPLL